MKNKYTYTYHNCNLGTILALCRVKFLTRTPDGRKLLVDDNHELALNGTDVSIQLSLDRSQCSYL